MHFLVTCSNFALSRESHLSCYTHTHTQSHTHTHSLRESSIHNCVITLSEALLFMETLIPVWGKQSYIPLIPL